MDISQVARETYDSLADEYETKVDERRKICLETMPRFAQTITSGRRVLDIGCAIGIQMEVLGNYGFTVDGIDISPRMIEYARKRNPLSNFFCGDFMKMQFAEKYDGIIASAFIHLYPKIEAEKVVGRMHSLLKPFGVVLITTTKEKESSEGFRAKSDYSGERKRFRKFWTKEELSQMLIEQRFAALDYYEFTDVWKKLWMNHVSRKVD